MEEIAQQFKEELQELLDRYKDQLTTPQIMRIAQPVFTKTIGFKDNPERLCSAEDHLQQIISSGPSFLEQHALNKDFIAHPPVTKKWSSEHNTLQGEPKCID